MTLGEARKIAISTLHSARRPSPSAGLDTDVLLSFFTGHPRAVIHAHPEYKLGDLSEPFFSAINSRSEGLPIAYITGRKEFYSLEFMVTPDVLIPKPDTEILVERAIDLARTPGSSGPIHILDVCTGSGCIAIAIQHHVPQCIVHATDISEAAIRIARINAEAHAPSVRLHVQDLRNGLCPPSLAKEVPLWDLIVSNPPYVPTPVARTLLEDGRNEPILALDGGTDGLDLIKQLADQAYASLRLGGSLLIEAGEYNAQAAADYLKQAGYSDIVIHRDMESQDRVIEGSKA